MRAKSAWGAALLCAALFAAPVPTKPAVDKAALEDYVRRLNVWGSAIQVTVSDPTPSADLPGFLDVNVTGSAGAASQTQKLYVSKDGQKMIQGIVYTMGHNPFEAELAKLNTSGAPSFGNPGAPVSIVVFSDFECGYCKEESKQLRENVKGDVAAKVRVFYMDFPLESIHPWAMAAAQAGRCVIRQKPAAYWAYHDYMFEHQSEITVENVTQKVLDFASTNGLDATPLTACMTTHATAAEVAHSQEIGRALGIQATPTLFINGRRIAGGIPWVNLQQIIDYDVDYNKAHPTPVTDKCCEITLPSPLKK